MTGLGRHVAMGGSGLTEALSRRGAQYRGGLLRVLGRVDRAGSRASEVRSQADLGQVLEAGSMDVLTEWGDGEKGNNQGYLGQKNWVGVGSIY